MVWRRGGGGLGAGGRRDAQSDAGRGRAARSTAASSSTAAPGDGNRTYGKPPRLLLVLSIFESSTKEEGGERGKGSKRRAAWTGLVLDSSCFGHFSLLLLLPLFFCSFPNRRTYDLAAIKFRGVEGWRPTSISAWRIMGDDLKQVRTSLTRSLWMSNLTKEEFVHVLRR
ncbi:Os05g0356201 [Oryza sativa Japonica Group]|uniref:Os05g0356201 protein n=1 Tax=Oryza sativa subsp. japonica TaxID=39947 RepID=A0A0P0WL64_ORYSJ|nr:hypothetical protein EE612_028905 [Oryza sativa]BAS93570.1 Os05g0356201 [Oryza sativa Japonica Group]